MINKFFKEIEDKRKRSTYKTYRAYLMPFVKYLEKNGKNINNLSPEDFKEYVTYMIKEKDWAKNTAKQFRLYILVFLKFRKNQDREHRNEIRDIIEEIQEWWLPVGKEESMDKQIVTLDDFHEFLKTIKYNKCSTDKQRKNKEDNYCAAYLLAYFGLRKLELIMLEEEDVDFKNQSVSFKIAKITRGSEKRKKLFFNKYVGKLLKHYLSSDLRKFVRGEHPIQKKRKHIKSRKLKIKNGELIESFTEILNSRFLKYSDKIRPHDLRRLFNVEMRKQKVEDWIIKKMMGHVDKDMTDLYSVSIDDIIKKTMLEKHFLK